MRNSSRNILHLVSSMNLGGAERFCIDLSVVQNKSNNKASIFSLGNNNEPLISEALNSGVAVLSVKSLSKPSKYLTLLKEIKKQKITTLHFHSPTVIRFFLPLLWLLPNIITIVYTRHGSAPYNSVTWRITHQLLRPFVNFVTFVSDDSRKIFLENHKWNENKALVIKNGVNIPDSLICEKNKQHKLKIASIGRMEQIKGQHYLLKALSKMPVEQKNRFEVHFFGDGSQFQSLKNYSDINLKDVIVVFHGIVKDREKIFNDIDLQVVCSESEGLSLAIMEGMARAIPTIATNVGGNPELVENNVTGILVPYSDTVALSDALLKLESNRETLQLLSKNARENIIKFYSLNTTSENFLRVYDIQ